MTLNYFSPERFNTVLASKLRWELPWESDRKDCAGKLIQHPRSKNPCFCGYSGNGATGSGNGYHYLGRRSCFADWPFAYTWWRLNHDDRYGKTLWNFSEQWNDRRHKPNSLGEKLQRRHTLHQSMHARSDTMQRGSNIGSAHCISNHQHFIR